MAKASTKPPSSGVSDQASLIVPGDIEPSSKIVSAAKSFLKRFQPCEVRWGAGIPLLHDKRSDAYYLICHLDSRALDGSSDLEAVLDPSESEEYKLNRDIYTDNHAYRLMAYDAARNRSFEDLVVEFDTSYRPEKPLKVFGGQHRIQAVKEALKKKVVSLHGTRVYFALDIEQKVNIATANNTSIAVSNDLLDRMQEDLLGKELREWCQTVGLLGKGDNFADKRSPQGVPTVRITRSLIVNFFRGKDAKEGDLHAPVVCRSGPGIDPAYADIRDAIDWKNRALREMGEQFARLHRAQRAAVEGRKKDNFIEFANKVMHPCVAASWAYAAGLFQRDGAVLKLHYSLTDSCSPPSDPLNATALLAAKHVGVDSESYRGLGARISPGELGRMLQVFVLQATKAKRPGITLKLANAAIAAYEAKRASVKAEKAVSKI